MTTLLLVSIYQLAKVKWVSFTCKSPIFFNSAMNYVSL